jgi:outer membrane protein assembly factor BamA
MKQAYWVFLSAIAVWGCSTTKRIGQDETLYTGVRKIRVESIDGGKIPALVESAVREPLNVKPNNPLFSPYVRTPLPIGLWAWNNLYRPERGDRQSWLYRRLAKEPVLVSAVQPEQRMKLEREVLDNLGYFNSAATYERIPQKNSRRARISYRITVAAPWYYSRVAFPEIIGPITRRIDSLKTSSLLHAGARYDIDTLTAERLRITNSLRNDGYYYFRPEHLEYLADTMEERYRVDLRMTVATAGIPPAARQRYRNGEIGVRLFSSTGTGEPDSTFYNGIRIWYQRPLKLRPRILARSLTLRPGDPTRVEDIERTLNNLTGLGIFRYVNLNVPSLDSLRGADSLNMEISAAFDAPLNAELEVDLTQKSNSFIGPRAAFSVRNKNFLRGGETFSVGVNASYEWQTGNTASQINASAVNSYALGLKVSLAVPRMVAPRFIPRSRRYAAKTTFQLGADLMNRPKFFTMLSASASATYDFRSAAAGSHSLTPLRLTYNHLLRTTADFDVLMADNEAIRRSFENQFIPALSYTYTWDRTVGRRRLVWQSTATEAGNIVSGVERLFGKRDTQKLFGSAFSQFVKGTTELRHYRQIGRGNTLAGRLTVGAGVPVGHSDVLPYSEQLVIGGANSIRAFTIRSMGPGSFRADPNKRFGYFDQTGEFKLEANVEYRFHLIAGLNGAVFVDAGNVWLLRDDPARPGGRLMSRNFFREIALGTGVGLRLDITYLVLRADLGVAIHAPYDTGKSGYFNIPGFRHGLGFHLAIGYPF